MYLKIAFCESVFLKMLGFFCKRNGTKCSPSLVRDQAWSWPWWKVSCGLGVCVKPALHSNTNRIQLVVCSKISPCVMRYYLNVQYDFLKSYLTIFGIEHVPVPNDKSYSIVLFWPISGLSLVFVYTSQTIDYLYM